MQEQISGCGSIGVNTISPRLVEKFNVWCHFNNGRYRNTGRWVVEVAATDSCSVSVAYMTQTYLFCDEILCVFLKLECKINSL